MLRKTKPPVPRRAIAAVEMAVCLPVLLAIVLGAIQTCELIHLQHAATIAVYEGTLSASDPTSTKAAVLDRAESVLEALEIKNARVVMTPDFPNIAEIPIGTHVQVSVEVPTLGNLLTPRVLPVPDSLTASGVLMR